MKPARCIASFDSASGYLRALGRFLGGRDFPGLGEVPDAVPNRLVAGVGGALNRLHEGLRKQLYIWSGWAEAIPPRRAGEVDAEEIGRWVTSHYPERRYPAVMIGSSNGAAVHLCAALGIPWLPQTLLVPVRQSVHPDEPVDGLEAAREPARAMLTRNPEVELHQMHDPVQDRLMIRRMTYFRIKRLRLGAAYREFIERCVEPDGTILVLDCGLRWPTRQVGERHFFQHGALGGATPDEVMRGGERVAAYLAAHGSHRRRWEPPEPDGERPEAEWGFVPALLEDLADVARGRGLRLRRIEFGEPEDLSPFVADLHRSWFERSGIWSGRLLVESFILVEPWWAVHAPAVPFWMAFNTEPSAAALERYLDAGPDWEEIVMMLFSHGVDSIGLAPIERWRELLGRGTRSGTLAGTDPDRYPRDFGVFTRYHRDLDRVATTGGAPPRLSLDAVDGLAGERAGGPVRLS